jgi:L-lactate dehydrogenase (cytochrome)
LIREWNGPLVIKGLQSPADARRAVDVGATAIMISNHGGRQLDTTPAPVDCVAPIRDAVGDAIELIVDGGIRRGTQVVKALALGAGPWMFQIYILKDRGLTREFVERCRAARYHALCLTVDTQVGGNRERDRVTGMVAPPKLTAASLASFVLHPRWSWQYLRHPGFTFENVAHRVDDARHSMSVMNFINSQFDRTLTWADVEWLIREWNGPLVIKGLQSPADAKRAVEIGATAIMISNHGGRQLDTTPAPVDCVAPIRDAVGDAIELIVDGGIRRGTHVVKALALGADACSIGRAYLYGLAAGGYAGVRHSVALLRAEVERSMALLGAASVGQIEPGHVAELKSFR